MGSLSYGKPEFQGVQVKVHIRQVSITSGEGYVPNAYKYEVLVYYISKGLDSSQF